MRRMGRMKIPDDHLYISIGVILHNFSSSGRKEVPIQVSSASRPDYLPAVPPQLNFSRTNDEDPSSSI